MKSIVFTSLALLLALTTSAAAQNRGGNQQRARAGGGGGQQFIGNASNRVINQQPRGGGRTRGAATTQQADPAPTPAPVAPTPIAAPTPLPAQLPATTRPASMSQNEIQALHLQIAREEQEALATRLREAAAADQARLERELRGQRELAAIKQRAQNIILAASDSCLGILDDLNQVLTFAGATHVASIVGTGTGAIALAAGVVRSLTERQIRDMEYRLTQQTDADIQAWLANPDTNLAAIGTRVEELNAFVADRQRLHSRARVLGHVRTIGGVATAVTSVASAITSGAGAARLGEVASQMRGCNAEMTRIRTIEVEMAQAGIPSDDPVRRAARDILAACGGMDPSSVESIQSQFRTTMVINIVGGAAATAGAVASGIAVGQSGRAHTAADAETRDAARGRAQTADLVANIGIGVATATSAFTIWFNNQARGDVTSQAEIAARCEAAF